MSVQASSETKYTGNNGGNNTGLPKPNKALLCACSLKLSETSESLMDIPGFLKPSVASHIIIKTFYKYNWDIAFIWILS